MSKAGGKALVIPVRSNAVYLIIVQALEAVHSAGIHIAAKMVYYSYSV